MLSRFLIPIYDRIDAILVKYGTFNSTQKFRMSVSDYYIKHDSSFQNPEQLESILIDIFLGDHFLRLLVQTEERLSEQYDYLYRATKKYKMEDMLRFLDMLERISAMYSESEGHLLRSESLLPEGPIKKALEMSRANPKWYLHSELIRDCIKRGGCCGRECRCCEKREQKPGRMSGIGHCTIECSCCTKVNGLNVMSIDNKIEAFREVWQVMKDESNKSYYRRMMRAFITGTGSQTTSAKGKRRVGA